MNKEIEIKDFQAEPSDDLADLLDLVAKEAKTKYGERVFSKFLRHQAYLYRSGGFERDWNYVEEMTKKMTEMEEVTELNDIDIDGGMIH